MEQERTKSEEKIERGVEALRAERGAVHDSRQVIDMLKHPRRTGRIVAATAGVCCIAVTAAIVLIPRVSAAAELDKIGDAIASLPPRQEVHLVATKNGEYEVELELYVDTDEVVLHGKDQATMKWKDDRLTTEFKEYSTIQDAKVPEWSTKTFVFSDWIRRAVPSTIEKKMVKAADVVPQVAEKQGISVNRQTFLHRIAFDVKLDQERQGHVVFNVEPVTLRPVLVEAKIEGERPISVVLGYQLQNLELRGTVTTETYDIDRQRGEIIDSFAAPIASVNVEGTTVLLHKAIADHEGNLTFIYSGSEALPLDLDKSKIVAGQSDGPTLALMPQSYDEGVQRPVPYMNVQVSLVSVRMNKPKVKTADLPTIAMLYDGELSTRDIELPVVVKGTLHWVAFKDVPVMRTGNSLMLLAPENVPFWTKKSSDAPTTGG
jgi:hypothetical protein